LAYLKRFRSLLASLLITIFTAILISQLLATDTMQGQTNGDQVTTQLADFADDFASGDLVMLISFLPRPCAIYNDVAAWSDALRDTTAPTSERIPFYLEIRNLRI